MYRQIFIPNEYNNYIPFTIPHEWYGQMVEVIVFPISIINKEENTDEDFYKLCGSWDSEQSAEEMASELKSSRNFNKLNLSF